MLMTDLEEKQAHVLNSDQISRWEIMLDNFRLPNSRAVANACPPKR